LADEAFAEPFEGVEIPRALFFFASFFSFFAFFFAAMSAGVYYTSA